MIWDRIDLKDVNTALKNIKEKKNVGSEFMGNMTPATQSNMISGNVSLSIIKSNGQSINID